MKARVFAFLAILAALLVRLTVHAAEPRPGGESPRPDTQPARPFAVEVVDDRTGRGVPLVELKTVANVRYVTDSAGLAAIDDPAMMGHAVFLHVASHGYEYPADGFGIRGTRVDVSPGGSARIKIKRLNVAERLYRTTGEGIYRDSVLLGRPVPIRHPLLNALVSGQDSAQTAVYKGKVFWFWGDTNRPAYPLGHYGMSGATSELPGRGGLDPAVGVDLTYWEDKDGFSRPTVPGESVPAWANAVTPLKDEAGVERLVAKVSLMKALTECVGRRLIVWDDEKAVFTKLKEIPLDAPLYPDGHPVPVEADGLAWLYFGVCCPNIRCKADWRSWQDLDSYEAFTCLAPGARYAGRETKLDRDDAGRIRWGWKRDTAAVGPKEVAELVDAGKLRKDEAWFRPRDVETKEQVELSGGSVSYNEFRKRWVMVAVQFGGKSSQLGEVWYSEADKPEGPWAWARKVVTHDRYSFYNPRHHPFFDQQGGRVIYFEGTYTATFSGNNDPTPRYDYNQVMYRLDLSDPRLAMPATPTPAGQ